MMKIDGMGCSDYINENLTYVNVLNITKSDGKTVEEKDIKEVMIVQDELPLPCKEVYRLLPKEDERDKWTLFENGTIYRQHDAQMLSKLEYCLQPDELGEDYSVSLVAFNCIVEPPMVMAYVKLCSTFFMSLTILVYLWLPKFRTLHGRICNLYFICLTLTFLLNVLSMFRTLEGRPLLCDINGYAGYFMVIATFMWLSVVSFDVWRRFTVRQFQDFYDNGRSSFFNYNAIVWITTSILTISIILVDKFVDFSYSPGVGVYSCWINTDNWSAMIYLYTPLAILIVLNGVLFGLTTRYIYVENKGNQNELNRIAKQRKARNRANYRVYLRLFIIMGGSWFLEVLGYICETEKVLKPLTTLNEVINCSQGMIIFLATFCNRDMIRSINKRIQNRESTSTDFSSGSQRQDTERQAGN
ncbi:probable G-protein coupled receptor Mth-like 11 [Drosophila kikkawai]|uniref:Probable G-protein coupled receptor Mth-like 11 n=1 Tax=Drosophila kikkawai TaxID=30033 RepID=A0A6P4IC41_DROKI